MIISDNVVPRRLFAQDVARVIISAFAVRRHPCILEALPCLPNPRTQVASCRRISILTSTLRGSGWDGENLAAALGLLELLRKATVTNYKQFSLHFSAEVLLCIET